MNTRTDISKGPRTRKPSIAACLKAFVDAGADLSDIVIDRQNDRVFIKGGEFDAIDPDTGLNKSWQ